MLSNNTDAREYVYKQAMNKFGWKIRNFVAGALQGWDGLDQFVRSGASIHSSAADQGYPLPLCTPW